MTEKGIVVDDATSGESVACRDAVQTDEDSNNRIIQLIDKASRPVIYQTTTPLRSAVATSDSFDIDPLPTAMASALLTVSDAEAVALWAKIATTSSTGYSALYIVTPIIVSDDATPVAVALLPPIILRPVYPKTLSGSDGSIDALRLSTYSHISIVNTFPTYGANQMAFHITLDGSIQGATVDLFAAPTSCVGRNTALDTEVTDNVWGASFYHWSD